MRHPVIKADRGRLRQQRVLGEHVSPQAVPCRAERFRASANTHNDPHLTMSGTREEHKIQNHFLPVGNTFIGNELVLEIDFGPTFDIFLCVTVSIGCILYYNCKSGAPYGLSPAIKAELCYWHEMEAMACFFSPLTPVNDILEAALVTNRHYWSRPFYKTSSSLS